MADIVEIDGKYYEMSINEEFIKTAYELKARGIKNWYFMLEIKNPELADLDPFIYTDKLTSSNTIQKDLWFEYRNNLWWFLRTAWLKKVDDNYIGFPMNRAIAAMCWLFLHDQNLLLCAPRQTYKTRSVLEGPLLWTILFYSKNKIDLYGTSKENSESNRIILEKSIDCIPKWLHTFDSIEKRLEVFNNQIRTMAAAKSAEQAINVARGSSANILMFDNAEYIKWLATILDIIGPIFNIVSNEAIKELNHYSQIFTSTPNAYKRDPDPFIGHLIPWTEKLYDFTTDGLINYKQLFNANDSYDIFYVEYPFESLRKDLSWAYELSKVCNDSDAIKSEI